MKTMQTLQAKSWTAFGKQQWDKTRQLCAQRLEQNAVDIDALFLLGLVAKTHGQISRALALFSSVVRRAPQYSDAWFQLGLCYEATMGHTVPREILLEKARDAYQRGLVSNDRHLPCLFNVVSVFSALGQFEKALPFSQRALATGLDNATAQMALAKNLHNLRRFDEAESYYAQALAAQPDNALWQWEYAMQLLITGRFAEGWQHYEARLKAYDWMHSGLQMYPFPFELWKGEELKNKTILIHGEQGLVDEIIFASLLPEIIERAGRVIVACSPPLVDLFTRSFTCEVVGHYRGFKAVAHWQRGNPPAFLKAINNVDFQCPLGTLPHYLRNKVADFEKSAPYLKASNSHIKKWNEKLLTLRTAQRASQLRVGLMWCGNLETGLMGSQKSIPLPLWAPLVQIEGVEWVSLQSAEYGKQLREHPHLNIMDVSDDIQNFDDTAAIIANMDMVISIDTSVAHLAGAMGKEVWVPLCKNADWRWQAEGDQSLWYRGMHLVRQAQAGDWAPVLETLQQKILLSKAATTR